MTHIFTNPGIAPCKSFGVNGGDFTYSDILQRMCPAAGRSKWGTDQAVGQPSVVAFRFKVQQASGTRPKAFALNAGGRCLGWRRTQL